MRLLINLPPIFTHPQLKPQFDRLAGDLEAFQQGRSLKYAVTERMLASFPEG